MVRFLTELARLTISLPLDLLEAVGQQLAKKGESRSTVVRHLLEEALREAEEQKEVERYIRGYQEQPQTEEDFGWSTPLLRAQTNPSAAGC